MKWKWMVPLLFLLPIILYVSLVRSRTSLERETASERHGLDLRLRQIVRQDDKLALTFVLEWVGRHETMFKHDRGYLRVCLWDASGDPVGDDQGVYFRVPPEFGGEGYLSWRGGRLESTACVQVPKGAVAVSAELSPDHATRKVQIPD
jgi:hypothetical protein